MYRQSRVGNWFANMPIVTKNLLIINLIMWLASCLFPVLESFFGLHYFQADGFKLHQVITYMFMHDNHSFSHVFFNMFAVLMFGAVMERVWGPKRFLIFYLVTGIGAGLVQELVWYIDLQPMMRAVNDFLISGDTTGLGKYWNLQPGISYPAEEIVRARDAMLDRMLTVGASGAVFGILLGFGMLFPNAPIYIMFIPIPIKAKWMVIGYGIVELFGGLANTAGDNVAHFAHLGGMVFGYFLIAYWRKKGIGNGTIIG